MKKIAMLVLLVGCSSSTTREPEELQLEAVGGSSDDAPVATGGTTNTDEQSAGTGGETVEDGGASGAATTISGASGTSGTTGDTGAGAGGSAGTAGEATGGGNAGGAAGELIEATGGTGGIDAPTTYWDCQNGGNYCNCELTTIQPLNSSCGDYPFSCCFRWGYTELDEFCACGGANDCEDYASRYGGTIVPYCPS